MSRGASVMDYGGLSELNLEDGSGRPIATNPGRSRVSSRPLSRYHSGEEDNDIVHVGRPRSRRRHSSDSSESLEVNRVDNQDILPHSAQEFGLSSRSHRRHDSRHPSDYRRGHSNHRADYDGRSYRDDERSYRDDRRSYRDDRRSYRDHSRSYPDDRYRDRSYRGDKSYRDDRAYRDDHRYHRNDDPYYRDRSRSRHRSRRHHSSRYRDNLEDNEGRLPVIIMFDNGRGRWVYVHAPAPTLSHNASALAMTTSGT